MEKPIAIYHAHCQDGTTAAAIFLKRYPHGIAFPLGHHFSVEEFVPIESAVTTTTSVYLLDCVLGAETLLAKAATVIALDHHISSKEYAEKLSRTNPKFTFVFDVNKSGASLAWAHFFPTTLLPRFVALIEDSDLWRFTYGDDTRFLSTFMYTLSNQPEMVVSLLEKDPETLITEGGAMNKLQDALVREFYSFAKPIWIAVANHRVPLYNSPYFNSRIGNDMSARHGGVSGVFDIRGIMVRISFRSRESQTPSALQIAEALNGGGHVHAAGTTIPLAHFLSLVIK